MEEESQTFLTIGTHRGLYRYKMLGSLLLTIVSRSTTNPTTECNWYAGTITWPQLQVLPTKKLLDASKSAIGQASGSWWSGWSGRFRTWWRIYTTRLNCRRRERATNWVIILYLAELVDYSLVTELLYIVNVITTYYYSTTKLLLFKVRVKLRVQGWLSIWSSLVANREKFSN